MLTDPEKISRRYEEYYRNLLQNRAVERDYEEHNCTINQNHEIYKEISTYDKDPINEPFIIEDLTAAIGKLKKKKPWTR